MPKAKTNLTSKSVFIGTIGKTKRLFSTVDGTQLKELGVDDSASAYCKELKWSITARKDVKPSLVKQLLKRWAIARNGTKPTAKVK